MYGLYGLFFENCTDCTDFFWKCTDFCTDGFKKVLATLNIEPTPHDAKLFGEIYWEENVVILAIGISLKFV